MDGDIDVVVISRVNVDGVEANTWTVNDLQPLTLLHRQVDQDGSVRQVCKRLVEAESEREQIIILYAYPSDCSCITNPAERSKADLPWKP